MMPGKLQAAVFRASLIFQLRFQDVASSITWQIIVSTSCTSSYMPTSLHTNFFEKTNKQQQKTLNYKVLHPLQTQYRSDA